MEHKFKIGDIVKLKHFPPQPIGNWNYGFLDYFKNVENKFKVLSLGNYNFRSTNDSCITIDLENYRGWNPEEAFELYESSSTSKQEFKLGDTVRIIKRLQINNTGAEDFSRPNGDVGKIGKVTKVWEDGDCKIEDNDKYYGIFKPNIEIELYQESKWIPKFKIGDKFHGSCSVVTINKIGQTADKAYAFDDNIDYDSEEYVNSLRKVKEVKPESTDLLEEARKRYPVGTTYKCSENIGKGVYKVEDDDTMRYYDSVKNKVDIKGKGYLHYEGKWAEIINESEPVKTKKFKTEISHDFSNSPFAEIPLTPSESYQIEQAFDNPVLIRQVNKKNKLMCV
jgi:hypothetical protein